MAKFNGANNNKNSSKTEDVKTKTKSQKTKQSKIIKEPKKANKEVKLNFKSKKFIIPLVCVGVLLVSYGTYNAFFKPDAVKQTFEQNQGISNNFKDKDKDASDSDKEDSKGSSNEDYFKSNKLFDVTYLPDNIKDYKTGGLTYIDPKREKLTSLSLTDSDTPISNADKVVTTELYGFAAFKDEAKNEWVRIPGIQPIPEVEERYGAYGGDSEKAKADVKTKKAKADSIYKEAEKSNTITELDFSSIKDLKKTDPNKALEEASKTLKDNAKEFAKPLEFYTQDYFGLDLTADEVSKTNEESYINILNERFFGLISKDSIDSLNAVSQKTAKEMSDNYGLNLRHEVYVFNDKSYIVIDGVAYKYKNVILDLYDNKDAEMNNKVNALGTNSTQPNSKDYKVSILVNTPEDTEENEE